MGQPDGIRLADAIEALRAELTRATLQGAKANVHFPIETLTVELHVGVTKSADGNAGFTVPFIGELGASAAYAQERTQTVTLVLGPPVDSNGAPIWIASATHEDKD